MTYWEGSIQYLTFRNAKHNGEFVIANMDVRRVMLLGVQHIHRNQDAVEHANFGSVPQFT